MFVTPSHLCVIMLKYNGYGCDGNPDMPCFPSQSFQCFLKVLSRIRDMARHRTKVLLRE